MFHCPIAAVLRLFAEANINLTRIESFPFRSDPRVYIFFLDFQADAGAADLGDTLEKVREKTTMFKHLGSYDEEVCP